ncbi:hypothetical protein GGR52DRAFT_464555 [Hypoxylon sp. FL1284]|nr:hypothetical protein GGR52DRAFT_464555 [Hypoxylon sp. FL1284]
MQSRLSADPFPHTLRRSGPSHVHLQLFSLLPFSCYIHLPHLVHQVCVSFLHFVLLFFNHRNLGECCGTSQCQTARAANQPTSYKTQQYDDRLGRIRQRQNRQGWGWVETNGKKGSDAGGVPDGHNRPYDPAHASTPLPIPSQVGNIMFLKCIDKCREGRGDTLVSSSLPVSMYIHSAICKPRISSDLPYMCMCVLASSAQLSPSRRDSVRDSSQMKRERES